MFEGAFERKVPLTPEQESAALAAIAEAPSDEAQFAAAVRLARETAQVMKPRFPNVTFILEVNPRAYYWFIQHKTPPKLPDFLTLQRGFELKRGEMNLHPVIPVKVQEGDGD